MKKKYAYLEKRTDMVMYVTSEPLKLDVYEVEIDEERDVEEQVREQIETYQAKLVSRL